MTVAAFIALLTSLKPVIDLVKDAMKILKQNGELTPEAEAKWDELIGSLQSDATKPPHWRIDP